MEDLKRRNTRQRAVVLKVIRNTRSHPPAEWIYREARKSVPNLSLGTVYRNLNILKLQEKISEVKSEYSSSARYDGVTSPHSHFHCKRCNHISDIMEMNEDGLVRGSGIDSYGEVSSVQVLFLGTCKRCLEREASP